MKLDSHHHFWRYNAVEYGWLISESIKRDFLPEELKVELERVGIDGVVSVHARQKIEETDWLLQLAAEHTFIKGVVGWFPLASPRIRGLLEKYAGRPKLRGVRHVVHDEPDDNFILGTQFNQGVAHLKDFGLTYDILIFERHLPQTIKFVRRHPQQVFILDHVAKPKIKSGQKEPWASRVKDLAAYENVYCKVSGMVTEADHANWTVDDLAFYFDTILEAFGPSRLMFGSDWPVCMSACTYDGWYRTVVAYFDGLSPDEKKQLFGGTAQDAYSIEDYL